MEWIISGYCRAQDQARTVMPEREDGVWEFGCDFPGCAYAGGCPIGKQLKQLQETEDLP